MRQHAKPEVLNDPIARIAFPGHVLVLGASSNGSAIIFYARCSVRRSPNYRLRGGPNFICRERKERNDEPVILHGCKDAQRISVGGNGSHASDMFQALKRDASEDEFGRVVDQMVWKPKDERPRTLAAFAHTGPHVRLWMAHIFRDPETGAVERPRVSCDTLEPGKALFLPTASGITRGKVRPYTGLPMDISLDGEPHQLFEALKNKLPVRYYIAAGMCSYNPSTRASQFFTDNHFKLPLRH